METRETRVLWAPHFSNTCSGPVGGSGMASQTCYNSMDRVYFPCHITMTTLAYHCHTAFLFTKSDIKTVVIPVVGVSPEYLRVDVYRITDRICCRHRSLDPLVSSPPRHLLDLVARPSVLCIEPDPGPRGRCPQ